MAGIQVISISLLLLLSVSLLSLGSCSPEKPVPGVTRGKGSSKSSFDASSTTARGEAPGTSGTQERDGGRASGNNPPIVTKASIHLENNDDKDVLRIAPEGGDRDGDTVTFTYEWTKNGETAGAGDSLSGFKRGDKISVTITPFDGKDYGHPKTLTTEIKNTCPKVIDQGEISYDGKVLTCRIKAIDLDGDALTYDLVDAPKGLTIDKSTGLITWSVPLDYRGRQEVKVKVSDGQGGEVLYTLPMDLGDLPDKAAARKK